MVDNADEELGKTCCVLEHRLEAPPGMEMFGGHIRRFWLDPARDYVICRQTSQDESTVFTQLDCEYQTVETPSGPVWAPLEWTSWRFGQSGEPTEVSVAKVESVNVNSGLAPEEFQLEFPVGTLVSDDRPGADVGRTGSYDYLVMPDGSQRKVTWSERFASYDRLMATDSGMADQPEADDYSWLVVFNICVVMVIALLAVTKRVFSRPAGSSGSPE